MVQPRKRLLLRCKKERATDTRNNMNFHVDPSIQLIRLSESSHVKKKGGGLPIEWFRVKFWETQTDP